MPKYPICIDLILKQMLLKLTVTVLLCIVYTHSLYAQQTSEVKAKSAFIVQFIQNIAWPNEAEIDTFKIGILSSNYVHINEFKSSLQLKYIKNKPIKIVFYTDYYSLGFPLPSILYVDKELSDIVELVFHKIGTNPTLIVTDSYKNKDLAMINFTYPNPRQSIINFEINTKKVEDEFKFKVPPRLLLLGGTKIDVTKLYVKQEEELLAEREKLEQFKDEIAKQVQTIELQNIELNKQQLALTTQGANLLMQQKQINAQLKELDSLKSATLKQQKILLENTFTLKQNIKETEQQRNLLATQAQEMEKRNEVLSKQELEIFNQSQQIDAQKKILEEQSVLIQTQKGLLSISLTTIILTVGLVFFIYRNFRNKKKAHKLLEEKNKEILQQKEELMSQADLLAATNQDLEKLSVVASRTDNAILIILPNGTVEWFNQGFIALTGYTQLDFYEQKGESIFNFKPFSNFKQQFEQCLNQKESAIFESSFETKNHNELWIQATLTPIENELGSIYSVIAVLSNISELKKAHIETTRMLNEIEAQSVFIKKQNRDILAKQQELEKAQRQIIQSEKMASIGVLTAGIAHEINNPVNFIYAGVNSIMRDFLDVDQVLNVIKDVDKNKTNPSDIIQQICDKKREFGFDDSYCAITQTINDVLYGAQRVTEIVQGLRNFSRHENEQMDLNNLNSIVEGVLVLLKNKYKHHIEIVKNLDPSLPYVECKAGKINQVIMNIISNAIDSIKDKGEISISTQTKGNSVSISIKDNGSGIPDEVLPKIFDPFYTTKDVGQGTGLGLAISNEIVKEHNGKIDVISQVGKGTEFIIEIPVKQ